ncbi:biotin/lipoyl-containing protein [Anoxynatronum buryatiense]|uniref:Biotin carboxyl carrier protein n=1 Tax=Anoxynatronum buryatiense TaxID=489973 RepID=A0AA46AKG1_9CLOT|nr:biotin/lipoyl-containing protein [Anoxynatronum buryatiense]SMP70260.1 Biotin carboxyl carrier protein [Anoxynatronum buryatiense]
MKKFSITVNGVNYEVDVEEIKDGVPAAPAAPRPQTAAPAAAPAAPKAQAAAPAPAAAAPAGGTTVEAPMPGNVWKIIVKEGQQVKEGETLIILEAMKMENEIPAPCDGVVASLHVAEGAAVNGGDLLVSLK